MRGKKKKKKTLSLFLLRTRFLLVKLYPTSAALNRNGTAEVVRVTM